MKTDEWSAVRAPAPPKTVAEKLVWKPFPLDSLPPAMSFFASEVARTLCVDPSMAILPMLSIAGAAIGNTARAKMNGDYFAPANVWSAVVCRTGERKSPVLRAVMRRIYDGQHEAIQEHARKVAEYEEKKDRGDSPLELPPFPHLYISEATTEAIVLRLSQQPRGLPLVMEELSSLFNGMNQYRAKGGNDREAYLGFYDAGAVKVDRKQATPPVIFVPQAFLSVTGMIQPETLARVLTRHDFETGMAARFLLASPPPLKATWTDDGICDAARDGWRDLLAALLSHPLLKHPLPISVSPAAMRRWASIHDRMEAARHSEPDNQMRAARSKLIGVIPRLSLILQMSSSASGECDSQVREIDDLAMKRAVEISEWCLRETQRVYGMLALEVSGSDDDDEKIMKRIEENDGQCTARNLMQWFGRFRKSVRSAEVFLESLAADGIGRWGWNPQAGRGRPCRIFSLFRGDTIPASGNGNASHAARTGNCVTVTVLPEENGKIEGVA